MTTMKILKLKLEDWLPGITIQASRARQPDDINIKVSVKENEVPTEKNSSRASIFATMASYISN